MKKTIAVLLAILTFGTSVFAESLSAWSKREYTKMSSAAFLNVEFLSGKLTDNITRKEFCRIIVKLYEKKSDVSFENNDNPFTDCDDIAVIKAYNAGIVNGKSDGIFDPEGLVTRQEMATMISKLLKKLPIRYVQNENQITTFKNRFDDWKDTSEWAIKDFATVCYYDIISGSSGKCTPLAYATKEQAVCMVCRVFEIFQDDEDYYQLPEVLLAKNDDSIKISWEYPSMPKYFNIVIKSDSGCDIKNVSGDQKEIDYPADFEKNNEYTVYVNAVLESGEELLSLPTSVVNEKPIEVKPADEKKTEADNAQDEKTPPDTTDKITDTKTVDGSNTQNNEQNTQTEQNNLNEKEQRVFPCGHYFESAEEAEGYMVEVCVPCWSLQSDGSKKSTKQYLVVNKALADDVVKIFTEIYNDASKFPIKDVGGYYWRNTAYGKISQHSYGTCIDINANENYYVTPDGKAVVGSYWKPGVDPYSIAEDSIVVKTFAKYGFLWGGNAWGDGYNKDYMHFTYLGK